MSAHQVGIIGLGAMGGAVARRLLARGRHVRVFDLDVAAVGALVDAGASAADAESVGAVDVLFVSLPSDQAVLSIAANDGLLEQLQGGLLIELSTVLPSTVVALAEAAAPHDVSVVDSPVSGGPNEALEGELVLMVGADDEAFVRAKDELEAIGQVERIGRVGDGKALKLVNNTMAMGNMVVAAEAFALGQRLGLSPTVMYDVLSRSGGRSNHFNKRIPYALADDFTARFALRLGEKDLRLSLDVGHQVRFPMPIAAAIHQVYESGVARGLGDEDIVSVLKLYLDGLGELVPGADVGN